MDKKYSDEDVMRKLRDIAEQFKTARREDMANGMSEEQANEVARWRVDVFVRALEASDAETVDPMLKQEMALLGMSFGRYRH
ncbi:hypothetical protein P3T42_001513 [Paraburkholderia sp. GAS38]|jgi:hypothetical protein|uniref:hypothetical protein n=1 Tax=Paraburkholderia sp. GAS38 TaxID=3035133 RepID=UPI003D1D1811